MTDIQEGKVCKGGVNSRPTTPPPPPPKGQGGEQYAFVREASYHINQAIDLSDQQLAECLLHEVWGGMNVGTRESALLAEAIRRLNCEED